MTLESAGQSPNDTNAPVDGDLEHEDSMTPPNQKNTSAASFSPEEHSSSPEDQEMAMAADLLKRMKERKGDIEGAQRWGESAASLNPEALSAEDRKDYEEALSGIHALPTHKGEQPVEVDDARRNTEGVPVVSVPAEREPVETKSEREKEPSAEEQLGGELAMEIDSSALSVQLPEIPPEEVEGNPKLQALQERYDALVASLSHGDREGALFLRRGFLFGMHRDTAGEDALTQELIAAGRRDGGPLAALHLGLAVAAVRQRAGERETAGEGEARSVSSEAAPVSTAEASPFQISTENKRQEGVATLEFDALLRGDKETALHVPEDDALSLDGEEKREEGVEKRGETMAQEYAKSLLAPSEAETPDEHFDIRNVGQTTTAPTTGAASVRRHTPEYAARGRKHSQELFAQLINEAVMATRERAGITMTEEDITQTLVGMLDRELSDDEERQLHEVAPAFISAPETSTDESGDSKEEPPEDLAESTAAPVPSLSRVALGERTGGEDAPATPDVTTVVATAPVSADSMPHDPAFDVEPSFPAVETPPTPSPATIEAVPPTPAAEPGSAPVPAPAQAPTPTVLEEPIVVAEDAEGEPAAPATFLELANEDEQAVRAELLAMVSGLGQESGIDVPRLEALVTTPEMQERMMAIHTLREPYIDAEHDWKKLAKDHAKLHKQNQTGNITQAAQQEEDRLRTECETAKAQYDAAVKTLALELAVALGAAGQPGNDEDAIERTRAVQAKLLVNSVVTFDRELEELRREARQEGKADSVLARSWEWYRKQPPARRVALSLAVSSVLIAGTVASGVVLPWFLGGAAIAKAGVPLYLARRAGVAVVSVPLAGFISKKWIRGYAEKRAEKQEREVEGFAQQGLVQGGAAEEEGQNPFNALMQEGAQILEDEQKKEALWQQIQTTKNVTAERVQKMERQTRHRSALRAVATAFMTAGVVGVGTSLAMAATPVSTAPIGTGPGAPGSSPTSSGVPRPPVPMGPRVVDPRTVPPAPSPGPEPPAPAKQGSGASGNAVRVRGTRAATRGGQISVAARPAGGPDSSSLSRASAAGKSAPPAPVSASHSPSAPPGKPPVSTTPSSTPAAAPKTPGASSAPTTTAAAAPQAKAVPAAPGVKALEGSPARLIVDPKHSRSVEGAIINHLKQNPEIAKQFGWDGKSDLHTWAGVKAHSLWRTQANAALANPQTLATMRAGGYTPDLEGYDQMMHRIGSVVVEVDTGTDAIGDERIRLFDLDAAGARSKGTATIPAAEPTVRVQPEPESMGRPQRPRISQQAAPSAVRPRVRIPVLEADTSPTAPKAPSGATTEAEAAAGVPKMLGSFRLSLEEPSGKTGALVRTFELPGKNVSLLFDYDAKGTITEVRAETPLGAKDARNALNVNLDAVIAGARGLRGHFQPEFEHNPAGDIANAKRVIGEKAADLLEYKRSLPLLPSDSPEHAAVKAQILSDVKKYEDIYGDVFRGGAFGEDVSVLPPSPVAPPPSGPAFAISPQNDNEAIARLEGEAAALEPKRSGEHSLPPSLNNAGDVLPPEPGIEPRGANSVEPERKGSRAYPGTIDFDKLYSAEDLLRPGPGTPALPPLRSAADLLAEQEASVLIDPDVGFSEQGLGRGIVEAPAAVEPVGANEGLTPLKHDLLETIVHEVPEATPEERIEQLKDLYMRNELDPRDLAEYHLEHESPLPGGEPVEADELAERYQENLDRLITGGITEKPADVEAARRWLGQQLMEMQQLQEPPLHQLSG